VDASDAAYDALLRAIARLRQQLAFLPVDDPQRYPLYRDLVWCYHEAFALLYKRIAARRVAYAKQSTIARCATKGNTHEH
jgi:hypothetical protein